MTVSFVIKGSNSLKYMYLNVNKYRIKKENGFNFFILLFQLKNIINYS
jgi:hypothetical protein